MMSKSIKRQQGQANYKSIHMKNLNLGNKQISDNTNGKNMQYFPSRQAKRQPSNYYLDISKSNTTNKESSQTSRYSKRQSNFTTSVQQQNRSMLKENQRLKKELKKYEKTIIQKEDNASNTKQLELELVETYRVINYYEGKIKELQKLCKLYEKQLENNDTKKTKTAKIATILQELRNSNSELRGKNQQKTMEINIITTQLRKMESKFYNNQQKIIQLNKKISEQKIIGARHKFIDDYEQKNLNCQQQIQREPFVKRRPQISKSKRILKISHKGESDSDGSGVSSQYKNSVYIKRKDNPSKSREDSLRLSKQKSIAFGNLSSRLNIIQNEVQALKKENQRLHEQLDFKVKEIMKLKEQNQQQQIKLRATFPQEINKQNTQSQKKIVSISKEKLRKIEDPTLSSSNASVKKIQQNNLSKFVSNISMNGQSSKNLSQNNQIPQKPLQSKISERQKQQKKKSGYSFHEIKQRTLRKLVMNISREDITYFNLIDNITQSWTSQNPNSLIELLQESPYQLKSAQISQFMFQYKHIMKFISSKERQAAHKDMNEAEYKKYVAEEIKAILKDNIAYFKNITIRRDFTLNIQLSNKFKNYERQLEDMMKKYGNKMPFSEWQAIIVNKWGLTAEEILFLQIKNYEEYQDIDFIHIADLGRYFLLE